MGTKHVNLNPRRTKDSDDGYMDWREAVNSGLISIPESLELEDQLRRYMDAVALKREAGDVLGATYKPRLSKELTDRLTSLGLIKLEFMGMRFAVQPGKTSRVSPELLLAHGVSPDIIQACIETSEYTFITMQPGREL